MSASELTDTAERLQALVAQGRYDEARECFDQYSDSVKESIRNLAPGDPARRVIQVAWHRVFEQTRRIVITRRAHLAARLARLPVQRRLYGGAGISRSTWEVLG